MLTVGDRFPAFRLTGVVASQGDGTFEELTWPDASGRWLAIFFWPKDFTFVCPTEIAEFGRLTPEFEARGARLLGASTDSEYAHLAWRRSHPDLRELPFPMVSDLARGLSQALGILDRKAGVCLRATFLVDPEGVIRHVSCNDLATGRSAEEVLRVLDALQTGELCPAGWRRGDPTLVAA